MTHPSPPTRSAAATKTAPLYQIHVHDEEQLMPVGHLYTSRKVAQSWVSFVSNYWRLPCSVRRVDAAARPAQEDA